MRCIAQLNPILKGQKVAFDGKMWLLGQKLPFFPYFSSVLLYK
jgi:hypothetical protein